MSTPAFVWLITLPLLGAPLIYLIGRSSGRPSAARWAALAVLAAAWGPFALAARQLGLRGEAALAMGGVALRLDGLSLLLAALALGLGTLVTLFSIPDMSGKAGEEKYYALLLLMIGAIIGLGCASDLFNLWVWFEAMAVPSYMLVAFERDQPASLEAGVKYLVQSAVGSALVLLGIALVLMQTGTLDLTQLRAASAGAQPGALLAAAALFVAGFGVKAALVPMHTWLPDAHSQAPSGISAMLSGVVIEAGLIALLRALLHILSGDGAGTRWGLVLLSLAAINMLAGNLLALRQTQVKRLLAYSSLSQVGYMLLGLGIAVYAGQVGGAQGGLFHLFSHGLMKGLAFLAAGSLMYALHTAAGDHQPLTVADLAGAARRYPLAALALSLAALGLGGLPPLVGFMSKWQIFVAGFQAHSFLIGALLAFALLNSVLSLAYYLPLVSALYRLNSSPAVARGRALPAAMHVPSAVLAVAVVAVGVWPGLLLWLTGPAGAAVMAAMGQ